MQFSMEFLSIAFFFIALIYSSVGFGGGSSYLALLAISSIPYTMIPILGLLCNLVVTAFGSWHFWRQGHLRSSLLWPFLLGSVPAAFIGGQFKISQTAFFITLGCALILGGARLLFRGKPSQQEWGRFPKFILGLAIGLLSGITGIGGGIFLSPILHNLGWGTSKEIASAASVFIFVNSLSSLVGQLTKFHGVLPDLGPFVLLFVSVFLGGQIGTRWATSQRMNPLWVRRITGLLTVIVGVKVLSS